MSHKAGISKKSCFCLSLTSKNTQKNYQNKIQAGNSNRPHENEGKCGFSYFIAFQAKKCIQPHVGGKTLREKIIKGEVIFGISQAKKYPSPVNLQSSNWHNFFSNGRLSRLKIYVTLRHLSFHKETFFMTLPVSYEIIRLFI